MGDEGAPFGNDTTSDLKFRVGERNLQLLDAKGYVAISQTRIDKDETIYLGTKK